MSTAVAELKACGHGFGNFHRGGLSLRLMRSLSIDRSSFVIERPSTSPFVARVHDLPTPLASWLGTTARHIRLDMDVETVKRQKETLDIVEGLSDILDTGLDRPTLDILVQLCQAGCNPEVSRKVTALSSALLFLRGGRCRCGGSHEQNCTSCTCGAASCIFPAVGCNTHLFKIGPGARQGGDRAPEAGGCCRAAAAAGSGLISSHPASAPGLQLLVSLRLRVRRLCDATNAMSQSMMSSDGPHLPVQVSCSCNRFSTRVKQTRTSGRHTHIAPKAPEPAPQLKYAYARWSIKSEEDLGASESKASHNSARHLGTAMRLKVRALPQDSNFHCFANFVKPQHETRGRRRWWGAWGRNMCRVF